MPKIDFDREGTHAEDFCRRFLQGGERPCFVMGTNRWADSIATVADIDGFIDDFTTKTTHAGKPIFKIQSVPKNALVVSAVVLGRPLTSAQRLSDFGLENLDYYAFRKYAKADVAPVLFLDDFVPDYARNRKKYDWVRSLFADQESVRIYDKLINFRISSSLAHMSGFTDCQYRQYFEDFLTISDRDEVFVDVGGYDGYTSAEFIKRYPKYQAIHFFEPEAQNIERAKQKLGNARSLTYYQLGLSGKKDVLRFSAKGSSSSLCDDGDIRINVDRLDDVITGPVTFIKMDIEGAERAALAGAKQTILQHRPRLAISVYHRYDDFYATPTQIISYIDDYKVYLRHYTEGVTETVMFFVPMI